MGRYNEERGSIIRLIIESIIEWKIKRGNE